MVTIFIFHEGSLPSAFARTKRSLSLRSLQFRLTPLTGGLCPITLPISLALLLFLLPSRIPILQRLLEAAPLPTSNRDDLEWTLSFDVIRRYNVLCRPLPCPGTEPAAPGEPLVSPVARICQARDRIDDPRTFQGFAMVLDTAIFRSRESAIIRPNFHLRKMVRSAPGSKTKRKGEENEGRWRRKR